MSNYEEEEGRSGSGHLTSSYPVPSNTRIQHVVRLLVTAQPIIGERVQPVEQLCVSVGTLLDRAKAGGFPFLAQEAGTPTQSSTTSSTTTAHPPQLLWNETMLIVAATWVFCKWRNALLQLTLDDLVHAVVAQDAALALSVLRRTDASNSNSPAMDTTRDTNSVQSSSSHRLTFDELNEAVRSIIRAEHRLLCAVGFVVEDLKGIGTTPSPSPAVVVATAPPVQN